MFPVRVLAVVSSLALVTCYVAWRSRETPREQKGGGEKMVLPGSKNPASGALVPGDGTEAPPAHADFITPPPAAGEPRTILPGSKSALIIEPEEEERTVLPGSKSLDRIIELPPPQEEP
jgi:hypothetical protein